ncbi:ABC transporter permease [Aliarcobacter cryaerophilus]|jgi:ABC-type lipoprotein release transport system permease subunit|uniref:ABC transporter permease n=1 Tax=Aliarcobacter cryaerophilus TaxID=28198 RepID=A0A1V9VD62_9BACT|nr:FtsX-like permease family protein [Aliarcobacter cryaerophilus]OQA75555.1 MAG: FtsX-like permease family protein [Candidatus Dependentiae bacterium ADurb.Bin246]MCT7461353.1 FtsX-like permease family protein [Aliarcobacter cryaerophilus]MCT7513228.1 FtsX-like permease family protein [Aliarcobacter cryaerophilus]OQR41995.1 ABC transporter permease [Aliarcobacter cryaerophilus]QNK84739.1 FtsX-like permease family protein [Aliarcobacter cryaerophilus]
MKSSVFINLIFLLLHKQKTKYISIFILATLTIFLLSTVIFIKSSLQNEILKTLESHNDFIIQKEFGGRIFDIENQLEDRLKNIYGVKNITKRVYGRYKFLSEDVYFTIIGVDFSNLNKELKNLGLQNISKDEMIVGFEVDNLLKKYKYTNYYDFFLPNKEIKKVKIAKVLEKESNIISSDIIILDINLARDILGINRDFSTNIAFDVPNELERANIKQKLQRLDLDLNIIQKEDILKKYETIFNYKGGVFLILYLVVLFAFIMILYQRYSQVSINERKQIAIFKAIGYSVRDIIKIKMSENFVVAFVSYLIGVLLAYFFVFILNAPILKNIFIDFSNIKNDFIIYPYIEFSTFVTLFLFFMVLFLSSVLIPVWKISAINPYESLR